VLTPPSPNWIGSWSTKPSVEVRVLAEGPVVGFRRHIRYCAVMKTCPRCSLAKKAADFPINRMRPDGRGTYCLVCQRQYCREHYRANRPSYVARAVKRHKVLLAEMRDRKRDPCCDCGRVYPPWCMDFDHVRGAKRNHVSRVLQSGSRTGVAAEIDKCDLVCANCHRTRTHRRKCGECGDCKKA
jgi:hypothetical protein